MQAFDNAIFTPRDDHKEQKNQRNKPVSFLPRPLGIHLEPIKNRSRKISETRLKTGAPPGTRTQDPLIKSRARFVFPNVLFSIKCFGGRLWNGVFCLEYHVFRGDVCNSFAKSFAKSFAPMNIHLRNFSSLNNRLASHIPNIWNNRSASCRRT